MNRRNFLGILGIASVAPKVAILDEPIPSYVKGGIVPTTVEMKKIAGYIKVSKEMLDDIPYLSNYLSERASAENRELIVV